MYYLGSSTEIKCFTSICHHQGTLQSQENKPESIGVRYTFGCMEGALELDISQDLKKRAKAYPLAEAILNPNRSHCFSYSILFQF